MEKDNCTDAKRPEALLIHKAQQDALNEFSNDELGGLLRSLMSYLFQGELPTGLNEKLKSAFTFLKSAVDDDCKKYAERCEQNRQNISKRYQDPKQEQAS